jgi:ParB/RepB/Spo0J family partition protein
MLTKKVKSIKLADIIIDRSNRQRTEIDTSDIDESIRRRGVLTPVCVREDMTLVFGERRVTSARKAGHTDILARIAPNNLSEHDLQLLELEENLMRAELPWVDKAKAMARLYTLSGKESVNAFADSIGYNQGFVARMLDAAAEIAAGNERVINAPGLQKAMNVITRQREREENNAIAEILDNIGTGSAEAPTVDPEQMPILNISFHDWAASYTGPKFNVIHCDFPYGVGLDDSDQLQVGGTAHATYDDSPDVFWALLTTLAEHEHRFISHSAHLIFWHSMKRDLYHPMLKFFTERMPEWTFEDYPLVWHKTDNRGIAPDVERRPRRIYETALFGWRGERKLFKLGSNAYGAPKEASAHPSTKPEPMLRYFLSMVVDPHTRLLDPTCGSGTALRAAESLGAASVLGLELDPEFYEGAIAKHKTFRATNKLAEMVA